VWTVPPMSATVPSAVTKKNDRSRAGVNRRRWFAGLAVAFAAVAGDAIAVQRCIGAHGEAMFAQNCPSVVEPVRQRPSNTAMAVAVPVTAGSFCARTPQQLEQQVRSALTTRNGVRLSGLALWRGVSARSARGEARELMQLLKAGSASVALEREAAPSYGDPYAREIPMPASPHGQALVVMPVIERQGFTQSEQLRFDIVRDHGCYWLNPRPQRSVDEPLQTAQERVPAEIEPVAFRGR